MAVQDSSVEIVDAATAFLAGESDHDDFGGLQRDIRATTAIMDRRRLLRWAARAGVSGGAFQLFGCGGSTPTSPTSTTDSTTTTTTTTSGGTTSSACSLIPNETQGPYPGDGSNGPNVLGLSGVVRSDIRSSFAGLSGTASGVPLTIALTIVSASTCAPLAGRAVYVWHCDALGRYSLYSAGATNQNYLRGVQEADSSGRVQFTSVFPGCYAGRWPHVHFEVYPTLTAAGSVANRIATSQIALPKDVSDQVYATSGYTGSASNLSQISLASDMVFSDGAALELATMSGSVSGGLVALLSVAVNA